MVTAARIKTALLEHWIVTIITMGVAVVLAWLQKIGSAWALPVFCGLVGGIQVVLLAIAIKLYRHLPRQKDTDEIEEMVRRAVDSRGLQHKRIEPGPGVVFAREVTSPAKRTVAIAKPERDNVLAVQAGIVLGDEMREKFVSLPRPQQVSVIRELRLELGRLKIGFEGVTIPLERVHLISVVPLGQDLSDYVLIKALDEMDHAGALVHELYGRTFG